MRSIDIECMPGAHIWHARHACLTKMIHLFRQLSRNRLQNSRKPELASSLLCGDATIVFGAPYLLGYTHSCDHDSHRH